MHFSRPKARGGCGQGRDFPQQQQKSSRMGECTAKGWRGRPQSPLLASAEAKTLLAGKSSYGRKPSIVVAPIWRDTA